MSLANNVCLISVYRLADRWDKHKKTNTYGIVFSLCRFGRVGRYHSQPCPSNGPTATR
ncbi:hypothetical protein HMPREF1991_02517 [Hoylesella loescheii DSM 19665 = JCM 12249 = ATCC 15930]|uniref:Uncharacterized protein n=1 Tax=Hoylesella loescheii DSM 19665 = JCM 12249 = ATCC 15930 TaxID=1122985 RepID=A0A069QEW8_HOYLO|nr:hypothetical protein HMPREF1991_02517 [Hoylesella loescheii DSM 19665 = JCM 12249 = ATCC 15930]